MRKYAWILAALVAIVCSSAKAAFVNGVEDFNGTSLDNTTWVPFVLGSGTATVSNGYLDRTGEYTLATRSLTVGVGDTVSARVMLTAHQTFLDFGLTATPVDPAYGQNIFDELMNTTQSGNNYIVYTGHANGAGSVAVAIISNDITETWFRLSLTRDTASTYTSQLRADDGSLMDSFDTTDAALPDQASIFLGGAGSTRFDWVAVPEPAAAISLLWCSLLLLRRHLHS